MVRNRPFEQEEEDDRCCRMDQQVDQVVTAGAVLADGVVEGKNLSA